MTREHLFGWWATVLLVGPFDRVNSLGVFDPPGYDFTMPFEVVGVIEGT